MKIARTVPVNTVRLGKLLENKTRRNYFTVNFNITDEVGRLVWTPEMGRDARGPLPGDPVYEEVIASGWQLNNASNAAENYGLDVMWRQGTQLTSLWGRLYNDTPVDTDTEATLTGEASGNGYAALQWNCNGTDFPTLALVSGDYTLLGSPQGYTASGGDIGPVTYFVLQDNETVTSGNIYIYIPLEGSTTILNGETLRCTPAITLS